ncbi:MAG: bifunctional phosphoribosyl-AMP cyclohydrolase/phosphoribosyl-ATP diphosphatase HisIE [Chloroflexi bacterium]|nr:bifunctional phosphoribosyl-AMP cyclohydrolase/phosphoribosyl-ATP diphosphatase HisIE [Chloroflexota bacterium]
MEVVDVDEVRFDGRGLVPAIVQDADTGEVLMLAYMNAESLRLTFETGETWFWSRSRRELWHKGATSGNVQRVVDVRLDCDGDTVLVRVRPAGPACHTGARSCFFRRLGAGEREADGAESGERRAGSEVLERLWEVIQDRKTNPREGSYTCSLFEKGAVEIAKKVGEEGVETAVASLGEDDERVLYEAADLVYHLMVLLAHRGLTWAQVEQELAARFH